MAHLIAKVFEHANYSGQYRWVYNNVSSVSGEIGFNDKISSIHVYIGNQYNAGDKIRFYQHANFTGGYLELDPGHYPNIHVQPFSFGDKISSIDILAPSLHLHPITPRLRVRIYEHINYAGQYRDILFNVPNFNQIGFNDKVSSIRVYPCEDYVPGYVCDFFEHANYAGGQLQGGGFGPGTSIPNIKADPYRFNDKISSLRIYQE